MELNDENTWPGDVLEYLEQHHDLFLGWEDSSQSTSSTQFDHALQGLRAVMNNHSLHGYHCTRLTRDEINHIGTNGMQLPSRAMLERRIAALRDAGLIDASVARKFASKNQADDPSRADKIWFCFYAPHIAGESGIESLLRYWGGEALYNSHDSHPQRGPILARIGIPCLVEADVPIASLRGPSFLDVKAYRQFLAGRGWQTRERFEHDDYATHAISATNIRRVIEFPHADFLALTHCAAWTLPLA
jgi:hypothetical protein